MLRPNKKAVGWGGVLPPRVLPKLKSDLEIVNELLQSIRCRFLRTRSPWVPYVYPTGYLSGLEHWHEFADRANVLCQLSKGKITYMVTIADASPTVWNTLSSAQRSSLMTKFSNDQEKANTYATIMGIALNNNAITDACYYDTKALAAVYDKSTTIFQAFNGPESEGYYEWNAYDSAERAYAESIGLGGATQSLEIRVRYEKFRAELRRIVAPAEFEPYGVHCYNEGNEWKWANSYGLSSDPRSEFVTELNHSNSDPEIRVPLVNEMVLKLREIFPNIRGLVVHELVSHRFYNKFLDGTNMELFDKSKLALWSPQQYEFMLFDSEFWKRIIRTY